MSDFPDFDQLLKLAQEQPEELERLRQTMIDELISQAPEESRRRLRGLQFQIDAQRELHSDSAMGGCMKISQMMHESFTELRSWLNGVSGLSDPLHVQIAAIQPEEKAAAKVLHFPTG